MRILQESNAMTWNDEMVLASLETGRKAGCVVCQRQGGTFRVGRAQ